MMDVDGTVHIQLYSPQMLQLMTKPVHVVNTGPDNYIDIL